MLVKVVKEGRAHKAGVLHFHADAVAALEAKLRAHLENNAQITTLEFKDLFGGTRKFVIPLAELFDARKVTLRVGRQAGAAQTLTGLECTVDALPCWCQD